LAIILSLVICEARAAEKTKAEASQKSGTLIGSNSELSLLSTVLLPSAVPDFYPVTTLYGARWGFAMGSSLFIETGLLYNRLDERSFLNGSVTLRGQSTVDDWTALYGLGIDGNYFQGEGATAQLTPGFHILGGPV
jgi:hypothetical protein